MPEEMYFCSVELYFLFAQSVLLADTVTDTATANFCFSFSIVSISPFLLSFQ